MGILGLTMKGLGRSLSNGISSGISSAASGMITGAVGGIFGGIRAKKQHKRNKEILALQNQYEKERMELQGSMNKEQAQFNQGLAKDMYDYTFNKEAEYNDPSAQMKRLKEAGLSPALLYGSGGQAGSASGSTAGAGAAQGVTALQPMGIQLALQAEMQQAQIEALRAQTLKTNTETAKTASDIENTKSETKLKEAKFKETLKNIDAISENIRNSQVSTKEQEFKNEILSEIKNQTISRYVNGEETEEPILITKILAGNEIKRILNDNKKLSNDEIELLNNKEILTALSNDIEAIAQGEIDRLKIPSENKKLLKKQYERTDWELRNDKALGDILNAIGGEDKYSKLLQAIAKWLFSK